jgi:hypothetical protein
VLAATASVVVAAAACGGQRIRQTIVHTADKNSHVTFGHLPEPGSATIPANSVMKRPQRTAFAVAHTA